MSKTKAQLEDQIEELENQVAELELQLESGNGADEQVPEIDHSRPAESQQERQNRLRSRHVRQELAALTDDA